MKYNEKMSSVAVLGAAGKMGRGILLLNAIELAKLSLSFQKKHRIIAVDLSLEMLNDTLRYIKKFTKKYVEKNTKEIRQFFPENFSDEKIADEFALQALEQIEISTSLKKVAQANIVFEAISEILATKIKIFREIEKNKKQGIWYFSNTSSIPIGEMNRAAKLGGRIAGLHFYNPPAVQKLVEIIPAKESLPELVELGELFAKKLGKTLVFSNDVAGFIGNGHFMRDLLFALHQTEKLDMPIFQAIFVINQITQKHLLRPMGIFQLADYVGIDVCRNILSVMNRHIENENLHSHILDHFFAVGVKGGQNPDATQKNGFLKYEKTKPVAVFDIQSKAYIPFSSFEKKISGFFCKESENFKTWKEINFHKEKQTLLKQHFNTLKKINSPAARLAKAIGKNSKQIAHKLFSDKVALKTEDVNSVVINGFYHAYPPTNNFFDQ